jgi:hypothetical protein
LLNLDFYFTKFVFILNKTAIGSKIIKDFDMKIFISIEDVHFKRDFNAKDHIQLYLETK